jgi:hypothetical protein
MLAGAGPRPETIVFTPSPPARLSFEAKPFPVSLKFRIRPAFEFSEAFHRRSQKANGTLRPEWIIVGAYLMVARQDAKLYQEALEDLMSQVIKIQTPGLVFPKFDAALHEASHCVVARREGGP